VLRELGGRLLQARHDARKKRLQLPCTTATAAATNTGGVGDRRSQLHERAGLGPVRGARCCRVCCC
jgi:hypothetical protein